MGNEIFVSSAFEEDGFIPEIYTCNGRNMNPEIKIGNLPPQTKTLALIMDDPDAPMGTFVHWVAWNIPVGDILEATSASGIYREGVNSAGKSFYTGPCPPILDGIHHYYFKVFALDIELDILGKVDKERLLNEMEGHVISEGELVGLFERM